MKKSSAKMESHPHYFDGEVIHYPDEYYKQIAWGLMLAVFGILWMAQEIGWINSKVPIGPLIVILAGLMVVYARTKRLV